MSANNRDKQVQLLVGTRAGGFIFRSDLRRKSWKIEGEHGEHGAGY